MKKIENYSQLERYISPLHETLSEEGKKKLANILTFWDPLKEKWAEARKKFWTKYDTVQFLLQLRHAREKEEELIKENHQKLEEIWFFTRWKKKQEKFIAEYLRDISRYGQIVEGDKQEYESITLEEVQKSGFREWGALYLGSNNIWDEWARVISKVELKEWVYLDLSYNNIWDEWARVISEIELKEWVWLNLAGNKIWDAWMEVISKMELKEWVVLGLDHNNIWAEWAKALAEMELKEWVRLYLYNNNIWDEWAKAISKMELKEWVFSDLRGNNIRAEWRRILENWVADAKEKGINCEVDF